LVIVSSFVEVVAISLGEVVAISLGDCVITRLGEVVINLGEGSSAVWNARIKFGDRGS